MCDVIEYIYHPRFNYLDFLERVVPIALEYVAYPEPDDGGGITVDDMAYVVREDTDYTVAMEDMFRRMGLERYDGLKGFAYEQDATYIEVVVQKEGDGRFDTFPLDVECTISIREAELDEC